MAENLGAHKLSLARELLDDLELSRLSPEQLLLKATRLARLVGATETQQWLRFELQGCPNTELGRKFMDRTSRWTDRSKNHGYWVPLAQIDGLLATTKIEMQQVQVHNIHYAPSSANPNEFVAGWAGVHVQSITKPIADALARLQALGNQASALTGIRSRVMAVLREFVSSAFYEIAFSEVP